MIDRLIAEAEVQNRAGRDRADRQRDQNAQRAHRAAGRRALDRRGTAAAAVRAAASRRRRCAGDGAGIGPGRGSVVWLADGIDHDGDARAFADRLPAWHGGGSAVIEAGTGEEPLGAVRRRWPAAASSKRQCCAPAAARATASCTPISLRGQRLGEAPFSFGRGRDQRPPTTLRAAAGTAQPGDPGRDRGASARQARCSLLDARSQWHRIGAAVGRKPRAGAAAAGAALLHPEGAGAVRRARRSRKDANLAQRHRYRDQAERLGDRAGRHRHAGRRREDTRRGMGASKGGVLVRFAGPRLEKGGDDLLPVPLRIGGRTLGGALSWSTPQPLGAIRR